MGGQKRTAVVMAVRLFLFLNHLMSPASMNTFNSGSVLQAGSSRGHSECSIPNPWRDPCTKSVRSLWPRTGREPFF